uniref:TM2 domain-containing protein n=1 Tax=Panagrellus redivivus TaxID=6233 RepID=A0A7E5A0Q3_PANRE
MIRFRRLLLFTALLLAVVVGCAAGANISTGSPTQHNFVLQECAVLMLSDRRPDSPLIPCDYVGIEFLACEDAADVQPVGNDTSSVCPYFGPRNGVYAMTNVTCEVLPCIECSGPRRFKREAKCVKFTGHYFLSTLLYSIFLGIVGVDRFCLGYSAVAVGKLMTLGGVGIWWLVDIFLLINGNLMPADDSQWMPYW